MLENMKDCNLNARLMKDKIVIPNQYTNTELLFQG